jgi:hypothetical protein
MCPDRRLRGFLLVPDTRLRRSKRGQLMKARLTTGLPRSLLSAALVLTLAVPLLALPKKWAVVVARGSKLEQVSLTDIAKLCKGEKQSWPDGHSFKLFMTDPEAAEMRGPIRQLFGVSSTDIKPLLAKLNSSRSFIEIVDRDEDVLRAVSATPGAVGIVDVYAIDSSVKVIRIDGRLPFDSGYPLKGE